jgi:hypothetical protein
MHDWNPQRRRKIGSLIETTMQPAPRMHRHRHRTRGVCQEITSCIVQQSAERTSE